MILGVHVFTEIQCEGWDGRGRKRLVCFKHLKFEERWNIQVGHDCERMELRIQRKVWCILSKPTED